MSAHPVVRLRRLVAIAALCLVLHPGAAAAAAVTAQMTYPPDGAAAADLTRPIQWTGVEGAAAYYLYLGSTPGAKDLVNTGEIQTTSYRAPGVPGGSQVYARLWTKLNSTWLFADSTFTTATSLTAAFTYPTASTSAIDTAVAWTWTTVPDAQAYYLYVGTTPGAKDLVDTGEIQQTSYLPRGLPGGLTVYARLWTRLNGTWRYTDLAVAVPQVTAVLTYPADGATAADPMQSLTWTAVAGAETYYLYVGTTPGAKDLINTGETAATSRSAASLPAGVLLYARIWTKLGGIWRYADSSFTYASLTARFTDPLPGATGVDLTRPWTWTAVPDAQAYYLYVGTTAGAKDLVNTGEIHVTSYLPKGLPAGQLVYARLWTKANNIWRYVDASFTAAVVTPVITVPADSAVDADWTQPIQWTSVAGAQAYYLYVGTTAGAKDLVDTGEIQQTSYHAPSLPVGQTVHARIWAKVAGVWRYRDSSFSSTPVVAILAYPANGAMNADRTLPATWTSVPSADAYYLYVGSTVGTRDLLDTGELHTTAQSLSGLPVGRTLYARLWTKVGGTWRYSDSTFSLTPTVAAFLYPVQGSTQVDPSLPIRWTSALSGSQFRLWLGTAPGSSDLADSGIITATSYAATSLPASGTIYARIWTGANNTMQSHSDIAFTLASQVDPAAIVEPAAGTTTFDASRPFRWSGVTLADGYRLTIGTAAGASDLHDSGEIHVTRRFVPNLPIGTPLFGQVQTLIDGQWYSTSFTFTVAANAPAMPPVIDSSLWATDLVRQMAGTDNRPFGGTTLLSVTEPAYKAVCSHYALALRSVLSEMNVGVPFGILNIAFDPNTYDTHTLVELYNADTGRWMVLDPTFDLAPRRGDGEWATAEELRAATLASDWTGVSYDFLGAEGDYWVRHYYLDYPLLYFNVYHESDPMPVGSGTSPAGVLVPAPLPTTAPDFYLAQCAAGTASTQALVNGTLTDLACNGIDGLTKIFFASSVAAPAGGAGTFQLYRTPRFVF